MANLTVDLNYEDRQRNTLGWPLTNTTTIYKGSLVGYSTTTGYAVKWADTAAFEFLGISVSGKTGDTSVTGPRGLGVEAEVDVRGVILQRVTVTGVTAITNVGDLVHCATDNPADLKTAANTNTDPVGMIVAWYSSTTCDVMLFTPAEHRFQ